MGCCASVPEESPRAGGGQKQSRPSGGVAAIDAGAPADGVEGNSAEGDGEGAASSGTCSGSTASVLHAGFLRKMKVGKNWKTRWCVLTPGVLTYFRAKSGDDKEHPQGYINLEGARTIGVVEDGIIDTADPEFQHAFTIKTAKGVDFVFAAMSNAEKTLWLLAFAQATGEASAAASASHGSSAASGMLSTLLEGDGIGGGYDDASLVPMSRLEIYASLCCFRVQERFIHRILREQKQRTFGAAVRSRLGRGGGGGVRHGGWPSTAALARWPLQVGWLDKKGRTRTMWKLRWFVLVGPFLLYFECPEDHVQGKVLKGAEGFLFLSDFELLNHDALAELGSGGSSTAPNASLRGSMLSPGLDSRKEKKAIVEHQNCIGLASTSPGSRWFANPLLLEVMPGSGGSIDSWVGAIRQAIALADELGSQERAISTLMEGSTIVCQPTVETHTLVADSSLVAAFGASAIQDQRRMLIAIESTLMFPPHTKKAELELAEWQRRLVRRGSLTAVDLGKESSGKAEEVVVFLFEGMLLVATPTDNGQMMYRQHQFLKEDTEVSDLSALAFMVASGSRSYRFTARDELSKGLWLQDLYALQQRQSKVQNMLDRYLGAVIFADVSGFSNLGDALERREHEERAAGTQQIVPGAPTASEELARILGKEVEKMVEDVTRGGGDVIKFAGDCVIAVFPAEQYMDLPQTGKYGSLALATGQAVRVSVQMMQAKNLFLFKSQQRQQEFSDEIAALVSKLNIHIAIGAGEVYGYHVGGVGGKWDYLISGPVMEQVRSADHDSGAGEVVLSKEAYARLKTIKMRKTFLESGNVKLETYFGPNEEPPFTRPWEKIQDQPHLCEALAANLQSYVPSPLVHQVESGNTLWLAGEKQISTIFCRLIGIDYEAQQGAKAVTQLAEIITQVQAILASQEGTLTRVISDDKGTSMLMAFDHPQHAVDAAMTITTAVENIPVPDGAERFRTAIGITTGVVFCGPVGGRIRAEYTMHGSVVNFSARLMTCPLIKNSGGILCDLATTKLAVRTEFVAQAPRHFKGFEKDVVSFMPTRRKTSVKMPVTDITDVSIELETDIDTASDVLSGDTHTVRASVDWEKTFQSTLSSSPRRNCVAVVETDVSGHWCMHEIQEAVKLYVPTMTLSNMCFNDQDQEHNRTQLQRFAQVASAADSVVVLQKADALDDANWQLLWNLCCTMIVGLNNADEPVSVVPGVAKTGGILVITIDPFHRDVSVAHPYNQLVSSSGIIYEKLHAVVTKDTGSHLGVPEEITLEVAAVVSAGTVDDEKSSLPCFCVDLIVAAHPYVRARSWTEATVYRHVETLCDAGSIRRRESSGGGHDVCEFQSHELHIQCYRRVLNEQRMPIHTAAVAWLEKRLPSLQTSPQASAIELYRQLRFHCLCIGENERAEVFGSMSSQDGGQKSSRRRLGPSHESLYVVTRWQNERRFASHYSGVNLLPDDPAAWCDQVYSESTRDDAVLPTGDATHRWEWVSDWVVKIESRYHPSDEDGWRYCYGFSKSVGDGPSWSEHQTATRLVRARQWFRVALRLPIGRTRHGTLSAAEARMFISQAGVEQTQQSDQPSIASPPSGGSQGAGDGRERTLREKVEFLESENGALQDAVAHLQAEALRLQAAGTTVHSTAAKEMWGVFSKRVVGAVRRAHPVATGIGQHRAKAQWYIQEHAYSKAEAELRRATAALDEWSAAERQMLRDELRHAQALARSFHDAPPLPTLPDLAPAEPQEDSE